MKVRDEATWQQLLADFASDDNPLAPELRDFTVNWAEAAEQIREASREVSYSDFGDEVVNQDSPMRALHKALRPTEASLGIASQQVSIGMIGAALVLLTIHWVYGEKLYDGMTIIEKRLVEDSVMIKMLQLNAQAQEDRDG